MACTAPPPQPGSAADSTWIRIERPTIVAFHPIATNDQIDADEDLATALDDLAFHLGSAMDSLTSLGVAVQYQAGDSVKLLLPAASVWTRPADSADIGYLFADRRGNRATVFGVRGSAELIEFAREFAATGRLLPR
jgi:hypothetical protein